MKRTKRTLFTLATLLLAAPAFSACLFTDAFGLRPLDSVPGAQVEQRLQDEAGLGFLLGCEYYLAQKSAVNVDCRDVDSFRASVGTAYFLAPLFAGIEAGKFYRAGSVEVCAENVFNRAFLYARAYLKQVERSTSAPGLKLPASDAEYQNAAVFAAFGAEDCGLRATGKLVDLGEDLSL